MTQSLGMVALAKMCQAKLDITIFLRGLFLKEKGIDFRRYYDTPKKNVKLFSSVSIFDKGWKQQFFFVFGN